LISEFLQESVSGRECRVLLISGGPGTGKTATVSHCIGVAPRPSLVEFVNCACRAPGLLEEGKGSVVRVRVLDEVDSVRNLGAVLGDAHSHECSIIGISNTPGELLGISRSGRLRTESIVFERYTAEGLFDILSERIGGLNGFVPRAAIEFVAKRVGRDRGDARETLSALNFVLSSAVRERVEVLTVSQVNAFLDERDGGCEKRALMKSMSLPEQFGLVAIFKGGGKDWTDLLEEYLREKHARVRVTPRHILENLVMYGFVSTRTKHPRCLLEKTQLVGGLEPIVVSLL
jgi:Cdc6-like AAA superfamily ATPase